MTKNTFFECQFDLFRCENGLRKTGQICVLYKNLYMCASVRVF